MTIEKNNEVNPYWILRTAKMDKISADTLYEKSIELMGSENEEENFTAISYANSAIILYALSVEHGLKALAGLLANKSQFNHNIHKLYQALPSNVKEEIKEHLSEERFKANMDNYIEENKNDFVDWRYFYEKPVSASTDFLKSFSEAIIEVGELL